MALNGAPTLAILSLMVKLAPLSTKTDSRSEIDLVSRFHLYMKDTLHWVPCHWRGELGGALHEIR